MSKYDLLEEMKNNMISSLQMCEIPTEIKKKLHEYYNSVKSIVGTYNSNPESIFEYADEEYGQVERILEEINKEKTNEIFQGIVHKYRSMEKKLDANEEQNQEQDKSEFEEIICGNNQAFIKRIIENVCDYVKSVEIRNARILSARGYSDSVIYEQKAEFHELIRSISSIKFEEYMADKMGQTEQILLSKIQREYEEYQQALEKEKEPEKDVSHITGKAEQFRKSQRYEELSMEEQRRISEQIVEEQKTKQKNETRGNRLGFLDDSIIK